MNNVIMRKIVVTDAYQPLADASLVGSVTITCAPGNAAPVAFQGDDGSDVPWAAGEFHSFRSVDLATIQVKGTAGDVVTVVGGTW